MVSIIDTQDRFFYTPHIKKRLLSPWWISWHAVLISLTESSRVHFSL